MDEYEVIMSNYKSKNHSKFTLKYHIILVCKYRKRDEWEMANKAYKFRIYPTKEGYDACLGYIEGAMSACCGHGVEKGYVKWN